MRNVRARLGVLFENGKGKKGAVCTVTKRLLETEGSRIKGKVRSRESYEQKNPKKDGTL